MQRSKRACEGQLTGITPTCIPSSNLLMHQKLSASMLRSTSWDRFVTSKFSTSSSEREKATDIQERVRIEVSSHKISLLYFDCVYVVSTWNLQVHIKIHHVNHHLSNCLDEGIFYSWGRGNIVLGTMHHNLGKSMQFSRGIILSLGYIILPLDT